MSTRIGFDHYTIAHRNLSMVETLEFARSFHFDGVQLLDAAEIDTRLDPERLAAFRDLAAQMNLYLEVGLPSPNPTRRSREEGRDVSIAEHVRELERHIQALAILGCGHARAYVGNRHDRFRNDVTWSRQIEATIAVLNELTPCLRAHGVRVALENHADLTCDELLALIDRLHPDVAGVTIDTGNLLMRLDDPIRAVERMAGRVLCTHVKDCVLARSPRGLQWQARAVGSGILPMPDLIALIIQANPQIALSIELHPRTYDLPINDPTWLAYFPVEVRENLDPVIHLAQQCEERYQSGFLERPAAVEAIPWSNRDLEWLAVSLGYLRRVVPSLS